MTNAEIAAHLDELGDLYELDGAIVHRVVAYRNAARAIRDAVRPVAELAREGRAVELPGVGQTIQDKIVTLLDTGSIPSADKLKKKFPAGLVEITRIPGFGPKRALKLYQQLGIASIDRLREVPGFGEKAEQSILAALEAGVDSNPRERILLSKAQAIGQGIVDGLLESGAADRGELAGSARRLAETCKDLDIVASARDAGALVEAFIALPLVEVSSSGDAGARGVTFNGMPVDLRVVEPHNFGNLLQHFTGSGRHNEALRTEAVKRGFHVSEYGVTDPEGVTHAFADEEDVYRLLDMEWIPPELREDRGELQAARKGS